MPDLEDILGEQLTLKLDEIHDYVYDPDADEWHAPQVPAAAPDLPVVIQSEIHSETDDSLIARVQVEAVSSEALLFALASVGDSVYLEALAEQLGVGE